MIDVHLWSRAGWAGAAFADWGVATPPAIAFFTNEEAAKKIFERWHERFGNVDKGEDIYLAIVRGISADHRAHYRVLITSRISNEEEDRKRKLFFMTSLTQTMHAESDVNLNCFLNAYTRSGPICWFLPS